MKRLAWLLIVATLLGACQDPYGSFNNPVDPQAANLATHKLLYDGNGATSGKVPSDSETYSYGAKVTVLGPGSLVKLGYDFDGWNTEAEGTGTAYATGAEVSVASADITLYAQWAATSNTITFDGNGGSGSMTAQALATGETAPLSANTFTNAGYTFTGWDTIAAGGGTSYAPGAQFKMGTQGLTLYAQWSPTTNTITYNGNAGSGLMADQTFATGDQATLTANAFTKTGYTFIGWNTQAGGGGTPYVPGAVFTMGPTSVNLYAQWTANTYQVTFHGNGGTSSGASTYTQSFTYDAAAKALASNTFTNPGYLFGGWSTTQQAAGGSPTYTNGSSYQIGAADVTLYAVWNYRGSVLSTISSPATTTPRPEGLMWDGTNLWLCEINDGKVYKLSTTGTNLGSFTLPITHALAWDVVGSSFWGTDYWGDGASPSVPHLFKYNLPALGGTAVVSSTYTLSSTYQYPTAMVLDKVNINPGFWVINTNSSQPKVFSKFSFNTPSATPLESWSITGLTPSTAYGICMDYLDDTVLWMNMGSTLYKISLSSHTILAQYTIGGGVSLLMGLAQVDATHFWVVDGNNKKLCNIVIQ